MIGFFFVAQLSGDNEKWVPYDTKVHKEIGESIGFVNRLSKYLKDVRKLKGDELTKVFDIWFVTNLGHVFEEAALKAYGVPKNNSRFNNRIPDGVEDGYLDQGAQHTIYPNSTFIEVKYMREISFRNRRIEGQIKDMINYLAYQTYRTTTPRTSLADYFPKPGKASDEELAILLFITPSNCKIEDDIIQYANERNVKIYQQIMWYNYFNPVEVQLEKPKALTEPSRHLFGHYFLPQKTEVNWARPIIDPDTGNPIYGY